MKPFSAIQVKLLSLLADGKYHGGNGLGLQLNVSRTAIWKHLGHFLKLGLPIERHSKLGYRLNTSTILLNENTIRQHLSQAFNPLLQVHLFETIDSTNRFLKELPASPLVEVCCAEMQTQGRGRFGRQWHSPFGVNIYCSIRWRFNCDLSELSGLGLVVSLAVHATLIHCIGDQGIQIKWPNDLLWNGKKICGSLIEMIGENNGGVDVIIGIGLNVNQQSSSSIDTPWSSLVEMTGRCFDRNILVAELLKQLHQHLELFIAQGFRCFQPDWQKVDYLKGEMINITQPTKTLSGMAMGVNVMGQLLLLDDDNRLHCLSAGDTSLKKI